MRRLLGPLLVLALVACGQDAGGIGRSASAVLDPEVQQVRALATSGDRVAAQRKLAELRQSVADLRQRGELSEAGAARVLAAVAEVEALLGPATAPTTQVSPTISGQRDTRGTTRTTKKGGRDDDEDEDD